jgi:hypothetical protein
LSRLFKKQKRYSVYLTEVSFFTQRAFRQYFAGCYAINWVNVRVFLERNTRTNLKKKLTALETEWCGVGRGTFTFRKSIMPLQNKEQEKSWPVSHIRLLPSFCCCEFSCYSRRKCRMSLHKLYCFRIII